MKRWMSIGFIFLSSVNLSAKAPQQGVGVGFVLGVPTGISLAAGPVRGALAYSILDGGSLILQADWLTFFGKVPAEVQGLNWYFGGGLLVELFFANSQNATHARSLQNQFWLGARVVPGLSWAFLPQWELFLEVGPGVYLFPAIHFLATGGLGVRFYF